MFQISLFSPGNKTPTPTEGFFPTNPKLIPIQAGLFIVFILLFMVVTSGTWWMNILGAYLTQAIIVTVVLSVKAKMDSG